MENLGRHLISVQWENGVIDYVYPFEIELFAQGDEPAFTLLIRLKGTRGQIAPMKLGTWESLLASESGVKPC